MHPLNIPLDYLTVVQIKLVNEVFILLEILGSCLDKNYSFLCYSRTEYCEKIT